MANPYKYRADHAGSLIVPEELASARRKHEAGEINDGALREMEDRCIDDVLRLQLDCGVDIRSDGEFRRGDFAAELASIASCAAPVDLAGDLVEALKRRTAVLQRELEFLDTATRSPWKIAVPAPGWVAGIVLRVVGDSSATEAFEAVAQKVIPVVQTQLRSLVEAGAHYVQLHNPFYSFLLNTNNHSRLTAAGIDPRAVLDRTLSADCGALDGLEFGSGSVVAMQLALTDGQPWYRSDSHDEFAEALFGSLEVDRFNVALTDVTADDFRVLRFVPGGKVVSLGLIRPDDDELEDADWILDRLDEADEHLDRENLAVCVQDGFGAMDTSKQDLQWKKLSLAGAVARRYWGFEM